MSNSPSPRKSTFKYPLIALALVIAATLITNILKDDAPQAPATADPAPVSTSLPAFEAVVAHKMPGIKLSLDCVITEPVDEATLRALGQKAYEAHNGGSYKNVFIMWYLPHDSKGAGAWGTTNFEDGDMAVRIMALQG